MIWTRRRLAVPGREPDELPTLSKRALEGEGFAVIERRSPHCSPTAPWSRQLNTEHSHAQKWMFCKRSVSSAREVLPGIGGRPEFTLWNVLSGEVIPGLAGAERALGPGDAIVQNGTAAAGRIAERSQRSWLSLSSGARRASG